MFILSKTITSLSLQTVSKQMQLQRTHRFLHLLVHFMAYQTLKIILFHFSLFFLQNLIRDETKHHPSIFISDALIFISKCKQ